MDSEKQSEAQAEEQSPTSSSSSARVTPRRRSNPVAIDRDTSWWRDAHYGHTPVHDFPANDWCFTGLLLDAALAIMEFDESREREMTLRVLGSLIMSHDPERLAAVERAAQRAIKRYDMTREDRARRAFLKANPNVIDMLDRRVR